MKLFVFLSLTFLLFAFMAKPGENLYEISFTTLEGGEESLYSFENQKLLIVVVPGQIRHSDTTRLRRIGELCAQYSSRFRILAVPANEDGFTPSVALAQWYRAHLGSEVVISSGMYTASTAEQSPLFSWLTMAVENGSFDRKVDGVGQVFFINERGELVAVLDKKTTLGDALIARLTEL